MTAIGFTTSAGHAEVVTDSVRYSYDASWLGTITKLMPLHHLDAAVVSQGDSNFGAVLDLMLSLAPVGDFDELVNVAQEAARHAWTETSTEENPDTREQAFVGLIGWSPQAERFAGYILDRARDFAPTRHDGPFLYPTPWTLRPSELELARTTEDLGDRPITFHGDQGPRTVAPSDLLSNWTAMPELGEPRTRADWVSLLGEVREQRALGQFCSVLVAGDLFHTTLRRGEVLTKRIHTFNDTGEEFQRLIARTAHPAAQTQRCWCGSGKTYGECHSPWATGSESARGPRNQPTTQERKDP